MADGFEYLSDWYWRLIRYRYPEQLLAETTMEQQAKSLADWIIQAFQALADSPPPK